MKGIIILGSTGSIGTQTLDVISKNPDKFKILGLACFSNIDLLEEQVKKFQPEIVCVFDENAVLKLKRKFSKLKILSGDKGLDEIAIYKKADLIVNAISGLAGLNPTLAAIKAGKNIALANKESTVIAGIKNTKIIPVDSELTSIFLILEKNKGRKVKKIILTASGGPFFGKSRDELANVTITDALNHPTWKMGKKITIDSATMINKAFEIIETHYFFDVKPEQIEVLIHPQGLVHAIVEFEDGEKVAYVSEPDMRIFIARALFHPDTSEDPFMQSSFDEKKYKFFKPNFSVFEGPKLAYEALRKGGDACAKLCYANEIAVEKFLAGEIKFMEIYDVIKSAL